MRRQLKVAIYEGPGARPLDVALRGMLVRALLDAGRPVVRAMCLCEVTCADDQALLVLGRFEPDARANLSAAADSESFALRDLDGLDADGAVDLVEQMAEALSVEAPSPWRPWFPVIDPDRCTNCKKCLSFCLFGVYRVDADGQIRVANPAKCKNNCPACARVCPTGALVFPKYESGPIAGADAPDGQPTQVDLETLSKQDIYAALRARSDKARNPQMDLTAAEAERCECLDRLQQQLNIPQDVLDSLQAPAAGRKGGPDAPSH
jgi:NAD-dependent dihydropyrimidine dehydrogenase PreA subunit